MNYSAMTTPELLQALKHHQATADNAYQLFTRCAASKGAAHVKAFCSSGAEARLIKAELKHRKTA